MCVMYRNTIYGYYSCKFVKHKSLSFALYKLLFVHIHPACMSTKALKKTQISNTVKSSQTLEQYSKTIPSIQSHIKNRSRPHPGPVPVNSTTDPGPEMKNTSHH